MKQCKLIVTGLAILLLASEAMAQSEKVKTIFKNDIRRSGGYGAATNSFTTIRGKYANIAGLYGGWFINQKVMLGLAMSATTNNLRVPASLAVDPDNNQTWQYGQFGLMTEYVLGSNKPVHLVFQLMSGAGFTLQYPRYNLHDRDYDHVHDENWFVVAEPGVQLEMNLFKWMRLSPGVSYRATFGSDGIGMKDKDLRAVSYNVTMKFGRF
jgi:hypothetical protein